MLRHGVIGMVKKIMRMILKGIVYSGAFLLMAGFTVLLMVAAAVEDELSEIMHEGEETGYEKSRLQN